MLIKTLEFGFLKNKTKPWLNHQDLVLFLYSPTCNYWLSTNYLFHLVKIALFPLVLVDLHHKQ